jgi:hypothetical protein
MHRRHLLVTCLGLAIAAAGFAQSTASDARAAAPRWFKGNLHTHSLWSDGDDYPEMIALWYKENGYDFLALSDHNVIQVGGRWFELKAPVSIGGQVQQRGGGEVLAKYVRRFGSDWVEMREEGAKRMVRLKPLAEYRSLLEEPGRFLLIPSQEVTGIYKQPKTATSPERSGPVHLNVTNIQHAIEPLAANNAASILQHALDAVAAQRAKTGQPMLAHINHPNYKWGVTVEELTELKGERFFEVYNGHPGVENAGDATHLSMDQMWDVMLTRRLAELGLDPVFGVGVDDAHHHHQFAIGKSNPGRGWVMVRARHLTAESIIRAMEAGDFYASSGVVLTDVERKPGHLAVRIQPSEGVTYVTQFIGTRRGYDPRSEVMESPASPRTLPHRRYSRDVGAVLAEVSGTEASYTFRGDEIYVRAKVTSSRRKLNGSVAGEFETAWVQPVVGPPR